MKRRIIFTILLFFSIQLNSQKGFYFKETNKQLQKVNFKLVNNLIVIPIEVNGKELSFILDTGVNKTILFNLSENDSVRLLNTRKVTIQGLGKGEGVEAILSKKNVFKINNIINKSETVYVVLKNYLNLSSKMGLTIHGVIGYSLFKNFVIKINYKTQKLYFYDAKKFKHKTSRRHESLPITFFRRKPYIKVKTSLDTVKNKLIDVKLLIDSGGSDAMWLFENSKREIKTPKRFFNDILGEGLSGIIYGNRSKIPLLKIGKFEIKKPTVSFLDSISTHNARTFKERNGSIGGRILSRFIIWIDYPNKKITFKKNGSLTREFNYNMSGIDISYSGMELVKEEDNVRMNDKNTNDTNSIVFVTSYSYSFKPSFKIKNVIENSPAYNAGLLKEDILLRINGKPIYEFKIGEIIQKFQEKDGKKIKLTIRRKGIKMNFEFRLRKRI